MFLLILIGSLNPNDFLLYPWCNHVFLVQWSFHNIQQTLRKILSQFFSFKWVRVAWNLLWQPYKEVDWNSSMPLLGPTSLLQDFISVENQGPWSSNISLNLMLHNTYSLPFSITAYSCKTCCFWHYWKHYLWRTEHKKMICLPAGLNYLHPFSTYSSPFSSLGISNFTTKACLHPFVSESYFAST